MTAAIKRSDIALPGRGGDPTFHLSTLQAGKGPTVVFVHGFPDIALGWHNQLPAVAAAGFQAIAPDMRGYGGSTCPPNTEDYSMAELTGDLVGLLDALDIQKAIFVGHDWSGFVVWGMAALHPERVAGVAALCTPYIPFSSVAVHTELVGAAVELQYVAWFQKADLAEAAMNPKAALVVEKMMRTSVPMTEIYANAFADGKLNMNPFFDIESYAATGELLLSSEHLAEYVAAFNRTGFQGGINWYRNIDQNAKAHPEVGVAPLAMPCLMLLAELDPALQPDFAADMPERCSDLAMHVIENAAQLGAAGAARGIESIADWLVDRAL